MNDEIFLRNYRLKIGRSTGSKVYEMRPGEENPSEDGLRITFQVTHFAGGAFSVAEITIYNVSRYSSRQMLGDGSAGKYEFITLEAGYDGLFGSIFAGQITNVQLHLEDADFGIADHRGADHPGTGADDVDLVVQRKVALDDLDGAVLDHPIEGEGLGQLIHAGGWAALEDGSARPALKLREIPVELDFGTEYRGAFFDNLDRVSFRRQC